MYIVCLVFFFWEFIPYTWYYFIQQESNVQNNIKKNKQK